ncbi:hypothetical protein H7H37_06425 [Mycolicibacterium insubricum]|nr:hypothetical protein [Mycolicibacterium insubricum]
MKKKAPAKKAAAKKVPARKTAAKKAPAKKARQEGVAGDAAPVSPPRDRLPDHPRGAGWRA